MDVSLDIRLLGRDADRVTCEITVTPTSSRALLDGAAVQLVDMAGGALGARSLLPLSGRLRGPVAMQVELRSEGDLPADALVVVAAWTGRDGVRLQVPARPPPTLHDFVRGSRAPQGVDLSPVLAADPALIARVETAFPWVTSPIRSGDAVAVLEGRESPPSASDLAETFDLHEDEASWLRDLLAEDDGA